MTTAVKKKKYTKLYFWADNTINSRRDRHANSHSTRTSFAEEKINVANKPAAEFVRRQDPPQKGLLLHSRGSPHDHLQMSLLFINLEMLKRHVRIKRRSQENEVRGAIIISLLKRVSAKDKECCLVLIRNAFNRSEH